MSLAFLTVAVVLPILLNALDDKLHGTSGGGAAKTSDFEVPFLVRGQPDDDLMGTGARAPTEENQLSLNEFWKAFAAEKSSQEQAVPIVSVDSEERPAPLPDVYFQRPADMPASAVFKRSGFQFHGARGKKSELPLDMVEYASPFDKRFSYLPSRG